MIHKYRKPNSDTMVSHIHWQSLAFPAEDTVLPPMD